MKTKYYNEYSYEELKKAVMANSATQTDIDTLGEWFAHFGEQFWNGFYYDAGDFKVVPVYKELENDDCELVRYEVGNL